MNPKKRKPNVSNYNIAPAETIFENKMLHIIVLVLVVFAVFCGTIRNGFVWDDDDYIHKNPLLTEQGGLTKIWKSFFALRYDPQQNTPQYYPLVFTSFYLEHKLWGFNPAGYHITNALLHSANTILLLLVLKKLGLGWYVCLITAALFGIHPIQVESVAWATERKNVLAGLFYFGAFLSFLYYQDYGKNRYYVTSLVFFVLALLSKTVVVTLPVALILAGYLRARPIRKTITAVIPFFALGIAAGLVTSFLERYTVRALGPEWDLSVIQRVLIASRAIWFYIGKILWPHPLSFHYERWQIDPHSAAAYVPLIGVIIAAAAVYFLRKKLGKITVFATAYFVVTISPALGFINFYMMRYSFVADHFSYLACWSIMLLVVAGFGWVIGHLQQQNLKTVTATVTAAAVLACCAGLTVLQVKKYKNLQTLWEHTIATSPRAWLAHNNLGAIYASQRQYEKAIDCYRTTTKLNPAYAEAHNNIGVAYVLLGQPKKAVEYYKKAIELKADYPEAFYNLGIAYSQLGQNNEAVEQFRKVVQTRQEYMGAWYNLALCLSKANRLLEATEAYQKVIELSPKYPEACYNLAVTYQLLDKLQDAIVYYKKAIDIRPTYIEAKCNLANIYQQQGRLEDAVALLHSALEVNPDYAEANFDLGMTYYMLGEYEKAKLYFRTAEKHGIETPEEIKQDLYHQQLPATQR